MMFALSIPSCFLIQIDLTFTINEHNQLRVSYVKPMTLLWSVDL